MAKNLYIIDGHAHIYAAYYAPMRQQLTSPSGEPTKATYIFTMALLSLIENHKPDMLVVAMDSKTPPKRREIYPEYKAHRPPMPDDMPTQIDRIEQILDAMHIPMLRVDGSEADDIIGTLAKKSGDKKIDVFICSKDKDMIQLLNSHVKMLDIKSGKISDSQTIEKEMGISADQIIDVMALSGDTSDNIPGVADVGPKTALSWIKQYGSLDNLYEHAGEIKGKRGDNLRNSKEQAYLSRELVVIDTDVPVKLDEKQFAIKEFDKDKLSSIFSELGFSRLITQLGLSGTASKSENHNSAESVAKIGGPATVKTLKPDYQLIDTEAKLKTFATKLKKQKLFAVDTETTGVDPMRADLVGLSFSWEKNKAYYIAVKAPMGSKHISLKEVKERLGSVLNDEKILKVGQNIKYDLLVLRNAGMEVKGVHFDTMVAAYCLDPLRNSNSLDQLSLDFLHYQPIPISSLIGKGKNQLTFDMVDLPAACEYAAEDADVTYQIYDILSAGLNKEPQLKKLFEEVEMPLVSVLAEMEYNGVSLDVPLLNKMSHELADNIKEITDRIYEQAGVVFNIDSPKQLAEVLFDNLGLTPIRVGKTGRSTDAGVLEELAALHPIAKLVLEYRTLSKLQNTYVDKLGQLINPRTNRVHASFNQTITATGRLSSSNPNLQNIPIRTEIGRKIRAAFVPAKKDDVILSADYSQIELRLLAHFSKDQALLDAFANDRDIHSFVASQIYNVPIDKVTGEMRSNCKTVNFGIIYGQGAFGLSRTTGMSVAEAKQFIDDYYNRYGSIKAFMESCVAEAKKTGYVETILNRRRKIANIKSKNANKRKQAQRFAVNTKIQGSAADMIKVAMINIQRKIDADKLPVEMILQIHDELVFELPEKQVKSLSKWISDEMTGAITLDVPLKVDINYGQSWLNEK